MKVNFFNRPYLLCIGDLTRISILDRTHLHIVRRIDLKAQVKAIIIVGCTRKPEIGKPEVHL